MTILGVDVSHWSSLAHTPVNLKEQGYDFLIWKSTQGRYYQDPTFGHNMLEYGDVAFAAFHYMDDSDPTLQYKNILRTVPKITPVIIDMEQGSLYTAQVLLGILQREGYNSPFFYLPIWYWIRLGRPDVSHFPPLWASIRVPGEGYGSELYRSVSASNWSGYGNNDVALLQFTAQGKIDGCDSPVDISAFAGDRERFVHELVNGSDAPPVPAPMMRYIVQAGDTLWQIAYNTLGDASKWQIIAQDNNLSNPNRLIPGQVLHIPGWNGVFHSITDTIRYTVNGGDTLTAIAGKFGLSVGAVYDANRLTIGSDPDHIVPGMVLSIPRLA